MASPIELRLPLVDWRLVETVVGLCRTYPYHRLGPKAWFKAAVRGVVRMARQLDVDFLYPLYRAPMEAAPSGRRSPVGADISTAVGQPRGPVLARAHRST
jgi:hypothetical protein